MVTKQRKKSSKSTTPVPAVPIAHTQPIKTFEEEYYTDMFSFTTAWISDEYIEKFAQEWVKVVDENPRIISLEGFFRLKRISRATVQRWLERSQILREAKELVLMMLAVKREEAAAFKECDSNTIWKNQTAYDPVYKQIEEWRAKLGDDDRLAKGQLIVQFQKFEDVPNVKPAKSSIEE